MKHLFFMIPLIACATAARAQTQPTPAAKAPVELKSGHMQVQARPASNRPDVPPQFPGGAQELSNFFQLNLKYPDAARDKQISGSSVVTFTVEANGKVSNALVTTPLQPDCDAEALRVVGLMPAWKPALRKGLPVAVQVKMPVPFGDSSNLKLEKAKSKAKFN